MRKLTVFNFMTLNGYYKGPNEDISWHKDNAGEEEDDFARKGVAGNGILVFGRVTYEMMASWWPTPMAMEAMPEVAAGMNRADKIVFSRTLDKADWPGTTLIKEDAVQAMRSLKQEDGKDMTILGSGSLVTQLAEAGLIDEYTFMMDPVAIGEGSSVFQGISHRLNLELTGTQAFKNGVIVLRYVPAEVK